MRRWLAIAALALSSCDSDAAQSCNVDSDCTQPIPADCTATEPGTVGDGGTASCHWFCSAGLCEVSS